MLHGLFLINSVKKILHVGAKFKTFLKFLHVVVDSSVRRSSAPFILLTYFCKDEFCYKTWPIFTFSQAVSRNGKAGARKQRIRFILSF